MTITHNDYTNIRKLLAISLAAIMVFGSFSLGSLTSDYSAFGAKANGGGNSKKDGSPITWSNGLPSGAHFNLIGHGKKAEYNCDDSPGGNSVFFSQYTNETLKETIEFVSNQKSKIENLTAIDPCSEAFTGNDPIQVQIPYEEEGYYVFWAIKGGPDKGKNQEESKFALAGPIINHLCNVTEVNSLVKEGDSDFGNLLMNFTNFTAYHDSNPADGMFFNETVYRDLDLSEDVTIGDQRLANSDLALEVIGGDIDIGYVLTHFENGTEMYRDTDLSGDYSIGEPIYKDVDMSGDVSVDDIRLFVKDGSEALSCSDEDLINGAGAITDKEAFKVKNGSLERFDSSSPQKGKGKSTFVDMTGMFLWSGAVCDATILTNATINTMDDGQISIEDFDVDGDLTAADLVGLGYAIDEADAINNIIDPAETAAQDNGQVDPTDDMINTEKEFAAFMEIVFGDDYSCQAIYDEWVFNLAQIVNVGLEIINDGATNIQMRFYPVATTEFTPIG